MKNVAKSIVRDVRLILMTWLLGMALDVCPDGQERRYLSIMIRDFMSLAIGIREARDEVYR